MRLLARVQGICKKPVPFVEVAQQVVDLLRREVPRYEREGLRVAESAAGGGSETAAGRVPIVVRGKAVGGIVLDGVLTDGLDRAFLEAVAECLARAWERDRVRPGDGIGTRALHVGEALDQTIDPVVYPIFSSVNYNFAKSADLEAYLRDPETGYIYTRWGNPTVRAVEEKVASLEGSEDAVACGSGMGAISAGILSIVGAGDEIVAMRGLYGGTHHLFVDLLPRFGVTVKLLSHEEFQRVEERLSPRTRLCYFEPLTNPTLRLTDPRPIAEVCRARGVATMVDNTFASPFNLRPLEAGIDLVAHSGTKYLSGHSDVLCGVVCGNRARVAAVRGTIRHLGATMSPWDAFLLSRGMKTFGVRMERHAENALAIARHLEGHPEVASVSYPGLPSHPDHARAQQVLRTPGGMICFRVKGGFERAKRFVDALGVCQRAASLGSVETLVSIPVLNSHTGLSDEELASAGVTRDMVRLSVGIEEAQDLMADLDAAFDDSNE